MGIDEKITHAKELIARREEIDHQLADLFGGVMPSKRSRGCKRCGEAGHDARSCPQGQKADDERPAAPFVLKRDGIGGA
jgi:hypothetical protein